MAALVSARKSAGLSQAALAEQLGRPPSFVAKVELAERRLDVVEFYYWARAVSDDPTELICNVLGLLPDSMPH
nr:helix-turn-helix transcriptional regulator [Arenibacterium halophilum]